MSKATTLALFLCDVDEQNSNLDFNSVLYDVD